ncbi:MAG TPA: DNA mismatch repair endonuclease MutL [Gemmata sp.]|nr:DNA mismatch repair endonuclease MutL [Gemmata sp.]
MARIRQLPPDVVTKIAAGEVIERPASVVKEFLENSIDARSTRIDIDLEAGGTELIRVVDDGCGIDPDDLPIAFAQHATSKLASADELFAIRTMGFRGEALASIAGVSQVTLQSRRHEETRGAEIHCDGGELSPVKPWNGSPGTRLEARHLFYNVPVRKKFLKSVATELGHVCEVVTRLALANPALHITLRHNGKLVYDIPSSAGLLDRIGLFFGGDVRDALYELDSGPGPLRLSGFIADPKCDRGNAKLQYLFVNGRWFRDRSIAHALQEAFRGLLMTGRYPIGFLFLSMPPDKVDVNVHPTKAEVRFQENSLVYSLVRGAVKSRLLKENLVPRITVPVGVSDLESEVGRQESDRRELFFHPFPSAGVPQYTPLMPPVAASPRAELAERTVAPWELEIQPNPPTPLTVNPERERGGEHLRAAIADTQRSPNHPLPDGRGSPAPATLPAPHSSHLTHHSSLPTGTAIQIQDSYIVLETPEGMLVIDQHALHERILFEQLRQRIREGRLEVQRLLIPEPIDLPAEEAALVLEAAEALNELGLEVSDFGGNTVLLSSYPTILSRRSPYEIFRGVVDYLLTKDRPPSRDAMLHNLMATMACKAAVKAGDRLSPEEIGHLLHLRQLAEDSHHCPHGRPTSLLFCRRELDKQFRRT